MYFKATTAQTSQNLRPRAKRSETAFLKNGPLINSTLTEQRKSLGKLLFCGACVKYTGFQHFKDSKPDSRDFKDLLYSNGLRSDSGSGVRYFSDSNSGFMAFGPHFRDFQVGLEGFQPDSRDTRSDFKVSRDLTSNIKVLKPDFRYFRSDFTDYRDFRSDFRGFRSNIRTLVHRISEVVGPSTQTLPQCVFSVKRPKKLCLKHTLHQFQSTFTTQFKASVWYFLKKI